MKRTKRRLIIREYDFDKLPKHEIEKYKSVAFTPFTKNYFEKRCTFFYLKGKKYLGDQYALSDYPEAMFKRLTGVEFYNAHYRSWLIKYNSEGEVMIRAGLRQPESRLGFVTYVEKDPISEAAE